MLSLVEAFIGFFSGINNLANPRELSLAVSETTSRNARIATLKVERDRMKKGYLQGQA